MQYYAALYNIIAIKLFAILHYGAVYNINIILEAIVLCIKQYCYVDNIIIPLAAL